LEYHRNYYFWVSVWRPLPPLPESGKATAGLSDKAELRKKRRVLFRPGNGTLVLPTRNGQTECYCECAVDSLHELSGKCCGGTLKLFLP
jgi:hypothetical protein